VDEEELAMESMRLGAQDYVPKASVNGELLERAIRYSVERKRLQSELAHQAVHDPLTGLPNRMLFIDRLEMAIARLNRYRRALAVIFFDVDNFKVINDSLGHDVGDQLLVQVAARLSSLMRGGDTVARLGGDEFCLLCEDVPDEDRARVIGRRIETALQAPFLIAGREIYVTGSTGVTCTDDPLASPRAILGDADAAMYKAKDNGRNRMELFDNSMRVAAEERLEMELGIRKALDENQFVLDFQPIIDLKTKTCVSLEALVRWRHPVLGLLPPSAFVQLAEESGLIVRLGRWVLEKAFSEAARWLEMGGPPDVKVNVNVSPRQLEEGDLISDVKRALLYSGLPARNAVLELTESTLMQLSQPAVDQLSRLKELGVKVALDDFGTGYSSLSYLQQFPVDIVKVDRSFVQGIGASPESLAFARAIVAFTSTLDMETVAEGIELQDQMDCLMDMDCPLGQGFLFSEPVTTDAALALLLNPV
jgi:diguanylate cyclase (GGDEF)-like protein